MQATLKRYYGRVTRERTTDWILVSVVLLLTVLGLLMAYSTTYFWSYSTEGNPLSIFSRQLGFAVLGLALFTAVSLLDYGHLRRFAVPAMLVTLLVLIAVRLFGDDVFGARRSLFGGSVQPSEPTKLVVVLYAAAWLASRRDEVKSISGGLLPFGAIIGIVGFLIVIQPDLSTTFVVVITALAMFFMANASLAQIGLVGLVATTAFTLLITFFPHSADRLEMFKQVFRDPAGQQVDYHIRQLTLTLGGAGLFGHGIGASYQKFNILPTPHTDSVMAVLADEMGLLGLLVTIALFGLFTWRGFVVAQRATTPFGAFMAIGITVWVSIQTLMNLLSVLSMIPFTGVPVPFLSVGGSSLVSLLIACGVLVSISRGSRVDHDTDDDDHEQPERSGIVSKIRQHGANAFHSSAAFGRRNSRTRAARTHRAERIESHGAFDKDIRFSARLKRSAPRRNAGRSPVRWRG